MEHAQVFFPTTRRTMYPGPGGANKAFFLRTLRSNVTLFFSRPQNTPSAEGKHDEGISRRISLHLSRDDVRV